MIKPFGHKADSQQRPRQDEGERGCSKSSGGGLRAKAAAGLVTLSALGVASAYGVTANLEIVAKIVKAIDLTVTASMNFGSLAATNARAGAVTIRPKTGELVVDNNGGLNVAGGVPQVGRIRLRGAPLPIDVSVAEKTVFLTNGISALTVKDFNFVTDAGGPSVTVTPNATASTIAFPVGATVLSRAGQVEGTYVGSNIIFANYQ